MNRIAESDDATVSTFTLVTPNGTLTGYFVEPGGPSTTTRNMDRRIPAGTYDVIPYSSTAHPDVYTLYNGDVPADRHILIHIGNYHNNTEGCLLPGSSYSMYNSNYAVWNSTVTFNSFHSLLGTHYAVLKVNDIP